MNNLRSDESIQFSIAGNGFLPTSEASHPHDEVPSISSLLDDWETGLEIGLIKCDEADEATVAEAMLRAVIGESKAAIVVAHLDSGDVIEYVATEDRWRPHRQAPESVA